MKRARLPIWGILLTGVYLLVGFHAAWARKAFVTPPNFDSGWVNLTQGVETPVVHNLGGDADDYVVDMVGWNSFNNIIHTRFGGMDYGNDRSGAYWLDLNATQIKLKRRDEDIYYPKARVRIWIDPTPDFDSGWLLFPPGASGPYGHNVGGNVDDYIVDFIFKTSDLRIHKMLYGGVEFGNKTWSGAVNGQQWGAYWHSLTNSTISLARLPNDLLTVWFRGRIWKRPSPDYDSGWLTTAKATGWFIGLPVDVRESFVYMEQFDMNGSGINHAFYGGAALAGGNVLQGSSWHGGTEDSIGLWRNKDDEWGEKLRIRVYIYRANTLAPISPLLLD